MKVKESDSKKAAAADQQAPIVINNKLIINSINFINNNTINNININKILSTKMLPKKDLMFGIFVSFIGWVFFFKL